MSRLSPKVQRIIVHLQRAGHVNYTLGGGRELYANARHRLRLAWMCLQSCFAAVHSCKLWCRISHTLDCIHVKSSALGPSQAAPGLHEDTESNWLPQSARERSRKRLWISTVSASVAIPTRRDEKQQGAVVVHGIFDSLRGRPQATRRRA